ncbi:MAG: hypothetical protein ACLPR9_07225 [Acidimicrobiales bacterium]
MGDPPPSAAVELSRNRRRATLAVLCVTLLLISLDVMKERSAAPA